ncbi:MAG: hypothetical protein ACP5US_12240 [Candidatus Kryptoniota bacterium]
MAHALTDSMILIAGLITGGLIGKLFGSIQQAALISNKRMQKSLLAILSGSIGRTTLLLFVLVLVQVLFPLLFTGFRKWLVSVGVAIGYGWTLLQHLKIDNTGKI